MGKCMIVGCGGVAGVAIHKCCQNSGIFEEILIASRTKSKCDDLKRKLEGTTATKIKTAQVDADNVDELVALFEAFKPELVVNLALPYQDLHIMDACLRYGVSYLDTEKLLFSQDAFGMHLAGSGRWYTDYEEYTLRTEAQKYFANILLLYSSKILDLLKSLPGLNLDIKIVAPDHGPMWKGDGIGYILDLYRQFAEQKPSLDGKTFFRTPLVKSESTDHKEGRHDPSSQNTAIPQEEAGSSRF